jgi:hypothetical protein
MKTLIILILAITATGCSQKMCGSPSFTKSNHTIQLQRQYGLGFHPDTTIFVTETLVLKTKKYQLWDVWIGDERYTVEYFAPTKRNEGFGRVLEVRTGKWLDCEKLFEVEGIMNNKYPY